MEEYVNATGVPPNISESMLKMILSPLTVHVPELPCIVHVPPDKIYTSFVGNVTYTLLPAGIGFRESQLKAYSTGSSAVVKEPGVTDAVVMAPGVDVMVLVVIAFPVRNPSDE